MDRAAAEPIASAVPRRWRFGVTAAIELGVLAAFVAALIASIWYIHNEDIAGRLLSPGVTALLLLINLAPSVALIVLVGRRIARYRVAKTALAGGGQLHVRLVAMFSLIASVPIVLTVIAASVMFQSGVQLWGSERARTAFESAMALAHEGQQVVSERWTAEARAMAADLLRYFPELPRQSPELNSWFLQQTYNRNLYHSVMFQVVSGKTIEPLYAYEQPDAREFAARVNGQILNVLNENQKTYINFNEKQIWVVTPVDRARNIFLYVATPVNADFLMSQTSSARDIVRDYETLRARARSLQVKFIAALYGVALLIVGCAMWVAILVADRLVRPIDRLVAASRDVSEGNFTVRVPQPEQVDEIGTLGIAFNSMTERLQQQTEALVSRNALIEAVMSGVSAGVISIGAERQVRLINASAKALLHPDTADPLGQPLSVVAPELDAMLASGAREGVVQITAGGETRTLAVKITSDEGGQVLSFDDITQQLTDQRRAAWADVARRIAHEIKNPLTPIQLAAERLQRRYGKQVDSSDGVFARLTDTIVRQVADLRRMVDEFSSFARMPKPVFRRESLIDMARQALFLHEVAHPGVRFELDAPDSVEPFVCDRRQIGQALTNIVKNAVEAIEARQETESSPGAITMTITPEPQSNRLLLTVADNGIGLPVERDRIVEPYMTTRSRGTGLGLAIVKKIVEEHCGTIGFADRPGGGTVVTLCFDTHQLSRLAEQEGDAAPAEPRPTALTRTGQVK